MQLCDIRIRLWEKFILTQEINNKTDCSVINGIKGTAYKVIATLEVIIVSKRE